MNSKKLHIYSNLVGLILLTFLLTAAFYMQIALHDLPCPLCLLQRVAFCAIGISLIFNLSLEIRARHYGLMLLSALFGFASAIRQVLLHILPSEPGFGPPILDIHMYTWSAILFCLVLLLGCTALLFDDGFHKPSISKLNKIIMYIFLSMIALNAAFALLECGFGECPENPTSYKLLS